MRWVDFGRHNGFKIDGQQRKVLEGVKMLRISRKMNEVLSNVFTFQKSWQNPPRELELPWKLSSRLVAMNAFKLIPK
jgi:hypothetical protein